MKTNGRLGRTIARTGFFRRLKDKAAAYVRDPGKLIELITTVRKKAESQGAGGALKGVWDSLMALFRLVRAYAAGEYRDISTSHLILIVAGLLYLLIPTDLIPDFIVGVGLVDDAAVLAWVVATARNAVDDFLKWESARSSSA